jgi:hypothetical protein
VLYPLSYEGSSRKSPGQVSASRFFSTWNTALDSVWREP